MICYKLTFEDLSAGRIVRFTVSKRETRRLKSLWRKQYPLRALLAVERVDVPTNKADLVRFLNVLFGANDNDTKGNKPTTARRRQASTTAKPTGNKKGEGQQEEKAA